jgi:4-cresol dehydrogenase (hydroxylating)
VDKNYEAFFQALRSADFLDVQTDAATLSALSQNVGEFRRTILGIIHVRKKADISKVIKEANRWKIPLYPFSSGLNWGYGSKLPARDGGVLLDLSALNELSIDEEQGVATIEPGVTQRQLADELSRRSSRYFLDVTGSGQETSVLGNALERGIAYNGIRVNQLTGMEVVLGNGTQFRTGFGDYPNPILAGLYSHGLGPSLEGLFFQSNLGIVIEAKLQLMLRPLGLHAISISISSDRLNEFIESTSWLKRHGYLHGIPHVTNRERTVSTIVPLLMQQSGISAEGARAVILRVIKGDWSLTASVIGDPAIVKEKIRRIKKEIGSLGSIFVHSIDQSSWKSRMRTWLISRLANSEQRLVIAATALLRGLHIGQPSDAGIALLKTGSGASVDGGTEGFLLCTPLAPLSGKSADIFFQIAHQQAQHHDVRFAMTLNMITDRVLEAVISVHFDRASSDERDRAHRCIQEMTTAFQERGFYPYRVNIDQMNVSKESNPSLFSVLRELKTTLDPNGIISPGRYS